MDERDNHARQHVPEHVPLNRAGGVRGVERLKQGGANPAGSDGMGLLGGDESDTDPYAPPLLLRPTGDGGAGERTACVPTRAQKRVRVRCGISGAAAATALVGVVCGAAILNVIDGGTVWSRGGGQSGGVAGDAPSAPAAPAAPVADGGATEGERDILVAGGGGVGGGGGGGGGDSTAAADAAAAAAWLDVGRDGSSLEAHGAAEDEETAVADAPDSPDAPDAGLDSNAETEDEERDNNATTATRRVARRDVP
jgi:hypothetical protein